VVKLANIIPVSDLRQDAAKVLKKVRNSAEPVIITQRGRPAAVLVGVEAYERSAHDMEILRLLAKGEREIESGEGYTLDAVLRDADKLLADDHPYGQFSHNPRCS
jgi:prevent-host-death family protein